MKTVIVVVGLISLCFAQGPGGKDPREIVEKVKIYRLAQYLDLTTEQAEKFFPRLSELHKVEKEFHAERMEILRELEHVLHGEISDTEINKVVLKYEDVQKKKIEKEERKLREMQEILTPLQRARYIIFEEEFNREIIDMIKEIKKHRRQQP